MKERRTKKQKNTARRTVNESPAFRLFINPSMHPTGTGIIIRPFIHPSIDQSTNPRFRVAGEKKKKRKEKKQI